MTHEFIVGTSNVEVLAPIDMSLKFEARRRCFVKALRSIRISARGRAVLVGGGACYAPL